MSKDFKLLNICMRHPVVSEHLIRACKKRLQKDGIKKIEKKIVSKLKKAGLYDSGKE